jgi:hypothetical protein
MWGRIDLVLRFVYVLGAPMFLVSFAAIVPLGAPIASAVIATAIALGGTDRWRARTARIPLVGRFLGDMAKLGEYYKERAPRPLLYYVFYPFLFPYWLWKRDARRELLLYRKLGAIALLAVPAFAAIEYLTKWRPIPFGVFATQMIAVIILQLLVTMALVMPIVTTVVLFHARKRRKTLIVLLAASIALAGAFAFKLAKDERPNPYVVARMRYRAQTDVQRAIVVMSRALDAGATKLDAGASLGDAKSAMRDVLESYWGEDEARVFALYRANDGSSTILYVNPRGERTIWLGRTRNAQYFFDAKLLPPDARAKLKNPAVK